MRVEVEGRWVEALVDTGAEVSIVVRSLVEEEGWEEKECGEVRLKGVTEAEADMVARSTVEFEIRFAEGSCEGV